MLTLHIFTKMILSLFVLVFVSCVPVFKHEKIELLKEDSEQMRLSTIKFHEQLSHKLRAKHINFTQNQSLAWIDIWFTNRTKSLFGNSEQNKKSFKDERFFKSRALTKLKRSRRFAKDKMSFMDDITYGLFGRCYNISLFSDEPFVMIDTCPLWTKNIQDTERCHNNVSVDEFKTCTIDMDLVPVTDSRGYIYKNLYCARCHNIYDVKTWEVELIYKYNSPSPFHLMDSEQTMTILGNFESATCTPYVYTLKPKSKVLCKNFQGIDGGSRFHQNRYRFINQFDESSNSEIPLSFQIFINFGISGKGHVMFSTSPQTPITEHHCDQHEIYDPELNQCRTVICGDGYILVENSCRIKTQKYEKLSEKHLYDATKRDYLQEIVYRVNITLPEIITLQTPEACAKISTSFADMYNITMNRIKNFKIHLFNGTTSDVFSEEHAIAKPVETQNLQTETNSTSESCNRHLVNYTMPPGVSMVTAELSFSLLPDKGNLSDETISLYKNLNFRKNFTFDINGTEFKAVKPGPIQLGNWCSKGKKRIHYLYDFRMMIRYDERLGQNISGVYINSTGKFYPHGLYDVFFMLYGSIGNISYTDSFAHVFVCDFPEIALDECVRFQISGSNYVRLRNNSILVNNNNVLNMDQYEYVDNEDNSTDVQICVPQDYLRDAKYIPVNIGCGETYSDVTKSEGYLSFVLGILSIVVLAAVIVTYCLFSTLRNLPGLNMLSLTISLFCGELLFITSGYVQQTGEDQCKAIGVFLHFIFLASFFWMNVMSYDVYCTFTKTKSIITRIRRRKKYFPLYSLYAWGSPALIVGLCCVIDFVQMIPGFTVGYGGSSGNYYDFELEEIPENGTGNPEIIKLYRKKFGCWIQEPVAALVAFGLPMILILLANAIMFIRTIICIRSVKKLVSKRIRHSSLSNAIGQHDVILYIRMSTVMGFTWIFGLASSIVSSFSDKPTSSVCVTLHVLGIFFIVLNCSQGLFIFFVFVLNRRVGSLYKTFLGRCFRHDNKRLRDETSVASVSESTHF